MIQINIKVSGTAISAPCDSLTAGMIGVPYDLQCDQSWDGLQKVVVFSNGTVTRNAINGTVPHEVLKEPLTVLRVGVVGRRQDGTVVVPTIWGTVGVILEGTADTNDPGLEPDNPMWAQSAAAAQEALETAQRLEQRADTGEFQGEPGPPGQEGKPYEHSEEFSRLAGQVREDVQTATTAAKLSGKNAHTAVQSADAARADAELAREAANRAERENIPKYAIDEAYSVIDRVQKNRTARSLVLSAMSDFHLTADAPDTDSTKQAAVLAGWGLRVIESRVALDGKLFLGDYTNGPADYTVQKVIADILYARQAIRRSQNELWCRGNHDLNYASGRDRLLTDDEVFNNIDANSQSLVTDWTNPGGGYGYRDFPKQKIRLVLLNTCDIAQERSSPEASKPAPAEWISLKQVRWIGEQALDFSDMPDAADWGIVFAGHHPINYPYNVFKMLIKMLEDYRDRKAGDIVYTAENGPRRFSYDFTQRVPAQILCALNGHSHNFRTDYVSSGEGVPKWLLRATVPQIMDGRYNECAADPTSEFAKQFGEFGKDGNGVSYQKSPGTGKGTSFYIVNIDRLTKTLTCTCYGAGHDISLPFEPPRKMWKVVYELSGCESSNKLTAVRDLEPYETELTTDKGYDLGAITVMMAGKDVTSAVCHAGKIAISSVTGDIVITAAAQKRTCTNLIPDAKGPDLHSVYHQKGFQDNTYLKSGGDGSRSGVSATGYMRFQTDDQTKWNRGTLGYARLYLHHTGFGTDNSNSRIAFYTSDGTFVGQVEAPQMLTAEKFTADQAKIVKYVSQDNQVTMLDTSPYVAYLARDLNKPIAWIRMCAPGMNAESVITLNEKIV